jgi:hypothetical protein
VPVTPDPEFSDDDLAESFFVVPSGDEKQKLSKENTVLKAEISTLQNKLNEMNTILKVRQDKDNALRDNILHARREVRLVEVQFRSRSSSHLQAQRVMTGSVAGQQTPRQLAPPDLGSLSIPPSASREREAQLNKRIKELEEDVKVLKAENESQVRPRPGTRSGIFLSYLETNDRAFQRQVGTIERVDEAEEGSQGCSRSCLVTREREDRRGPSGRGGR